MNTRIEELMYESGLTAQGCWDEMDNYDQKAIQRFVTLVVRECENVCLERAKVLDQWLKEHPDMSTSAFDFMNGSVSGSLRNAQYIRKIMDLEKL